MRRALSSRLDVFLSPLSPWRQDALGFQDRDSTMLPFALFRVLRSGRGAGRACTEPVRTRESVNHVSGIICKPCVRNGPKTNGDPGAIRTRDPQLRRLVLYPAELPGHDRRRGPTTCQRTNTTRTKRSRSASTCVASITNATQPAETLTGGPDPDLPHRAHAKKNGGA
jgi:hypothetical protein